MEWRRQQFFDVSRQKDTLTHYNAPTFLWSPQILELWYNREWRHFDILQSQAVERYAHASGLVNQLNEKKQQYAALQQAAKQLEQEYLRLVPNPHPVLGAEPDAEPTKVPQEAPGGEGGMDPQKAAPAVKVRPKT
jgi:hypothetical protein